MAQENPLTLQSNVNHELVKIIEWLSVNCFYSKFEKKNFFCYSMPTERFLTILKYLSLYVTSHDVKTLLKYLGVYLDNKLSWNKHSNYLICKSSSATGIFYELGNPLPMKLLIIDLLYNITSFIRICNVPS